MNVKTFLTGIIAFAAMTQVASAFPATGDYQSNVSPSGNWSTASSWQRWDGSAWQTATVAPDSTNAVAILSGDTITVNAAASADHLDVFGDLIISSATLTLDGSDKASSTIASGQSISLTGTSPMLAFTTRSHTFSGAGSIKGQSSTAVIQIANNLKLTSQLMIEGQLTMQAASGTCTFENKRGNVAGEEGVVLANVNGTLAFASTVILDDTAFDSSHRPLCKVDGSTSANAKIQFNRASDASDANHPRLVGRFEGAGGCATFEFLATVETEGSLVYTGNYGKVITNGAGAPFFRYDWVAGPSYTEIANCDAGSNCSCP
jgi:hypothetical protein